MKAESTEARVLVIIGTRPEGIKLAPVIRALRRHSGLDTRVVLTGQHGPLMQQVLDTFDLHIDHDLGIMREGQDLYDVTTASLTGLREIVRTERPGLIVVEGDTASVFAGALTGFFEQTRVGHVEAGLRSGDKWKPWPEEIFRRLTGVVTDIHFAPTRGARENLVGEGIPLDAIHVTGNTVVDALLDISEHQANTPDSAGSPTLRSALESGRRLVLVTAHRRESFGEPLRRAFGALRSIADRFRDVELLYPVHPNPNVAAAARDVLQDHPRITLCEPLSYGDLVLAMRNAALIITDSGGIQEEAPTFQKPVLVLRDVTERPDGVLAGIARLVGTDPEQIEGWAAAVLESDWRVLAGDREAELERSHSSGTDHVTIDEALGDAKEHARSLQALTYPNPYGDGRAGERIADIIAHTLTGSERRTKDWPGP